MNERQISRNPGPVEVRLHCLDSAVRTGVLSGRADGLLQLAEQYYEWIMKPQPGRPFEAPQPQQEKQSGGESVDLGGGGPPAPSTVPSLRQASQGGAQT